MTRPGLHRPIMPTDPPPEWEAQKPIHPNWEAFAEEMRKRRCCTVILTIQDGLPMSAIPTDPDAKMVFGKRSA